MYITKIEQLEEKKRGRKGICSSTPNNKELSFNFIELSPHMFLLFFALGKIGKQEI